MLSLANLRILSESSLGTLESMFCIIFKNVTESENQKVDVDFVFPIFGAYLLLDFYTDNFWCGQCMLMGLLMQKLLLF